MPTGKICSRPQPQKALFAIRIDTSTRFANKKIFVGDLSRKTMGNSAVDRALDLQPLEVLPEVFTYLVMLKP